MSRRKLTPAAQRPLTAISGPGEMIKFGKRPPPPTPSAPVIGTVTISPDGNQVIGTVFTCNWTLASGYPPPTAAYQWMADAVDIAGATNQTFDSTGRSEAEVITCKVTLTNSEGSDGPTTSSNSATLTAVPLDPPVNTVAPTISPSGAQDIGTVFTADEGTWTGAPTIIYTYQWKADAVAIGGETNKTFDSTGRSGGEVITCDVTGTNGDGNSTAGSSNSATLNAVPAGDRATQLLSSETDGLAIAFVDDSMLVKTAGAGTSTDILTGGVVPQSTTPQKIIRGSNGLLGYQKNNYVKNTHNVVNADTQWDGSTVTLSGNTDLADGVTATYGARYQAIRNDTNFTGTVRVIAEINTDQAQSVFTLVTNGTPTYIDGQSRTLNVGDNVVSWDVSLGATATYARLVCDGDDTYPQTMIIKNLRLVQLPCADTSYIANPGTGVTWGLPIDHDASNNSLGVLNEPQATNLILNNVDFGGSWSSTVCTATPDSGVGPSGNTDATLLEASSNGSVCQRYQLGKTVAAGDIVASCYLKAGTIGWAKINCYDGGDFRAWFNLSNGTVGTVGAGLSSASIEDVGNGWYRCIAVRNSPGGSNAGISVEPCNGDNTGDVSTGDNILAIYAQLEEGPATSPIITAGSQVTRDDDQYNYDMTGISWLPLGPGHGYIRGTFYDGSATRRVVNVATGNHPFQTTAAATASLQTRPGVAIAFGQTDGEDTKAAYSYDNGLTNPFVLSMDGQTVANVNVPGNNFDGTGLYINGDITGTANWINHCHIQEFYFAKSEKTQTELNTLTTP